MSWNIDTKHDIIDRMPFGKCAGVMVGTVIEDDPSYIEWALANTEFRLSEAALEYLEKNK